MTRRLLIVIPAALLVAACGTPTLSTGTAPAADAAGAATSAAAASASPTAEPTTEATTTPAAEASTDPVEAVVPAQVAEPVVVRSTAVAAPRPVAQVVARPAVPAPAAPKPAPPKPPTPKPAPAPASGCNVNYTPCVPDDAVDVDCQGGKGNGPSYVKGPVTVTGTDVYGLDADHDGIGCEK